MHYVLLVIAVFNGRYYHEEPRYVIPCPDKVTCERRAAAFPTAGIEFQKAVCVPVVDLDHINKDSK